MKIAFIAGKIKNLHLLLSNAISLQIFRQKFYRNVSWVVLHQTYHFCPNLWIWSVALATERQNLRQNIQKSSPQKPEGGQNWNSAEMFVALASTKMMFLLPLLMHFHCDGNLKFPLTYNGKSENWPLFLCHCRYSDKHFTETFLE